MSSGASHHFFRVFKNAQSSLIGLSPLVCFIVLKRYTAVDLRQEELHLDTHKS
jgi:hypothetical protein